MLDSNKINDGNRESSYKMQQPHHLCLGQFPLQGNRMKLCLNSNESSPVAIGGCSKQPFGLDARLARDGSLTDQIQGHTLEDSQVVCSVALSQTRLTVGEGHIQAPV